MSGGPTRKEARLTELELALTVETYYREVAPGGHGALTRAAEGLSRRLRLLLDEDTQRREPQMRNMNGMRVLLSMVRQAAGGRGPEASRPIRDMVRLRRSEPERYGKLLAEAEGKEKLIRLIERLRGVAAKPPRPAARRPRKAALEDEPRLFAPPPPERGPGGDEALKGLLRAREGDPGLRCDTITYLNLRTDWQKSHPVAPFPFGDDDAALAKALRRLAALDIKERLYFFPDRYLSPAARQWLTTHVAGLRQEGRTSVTVDALFEALPDELRPASDLAQDETRERFVAAVRAALPDCQGMGGKKGKQIVTLASGSRSTPADDAARWARQEGRRVDGKELKERFGVEPSTTGLVRCEGHTWFDASLVQLSEAQETAAQAVIEEALATHQADGVSYAPQRDVMLALRARHEEWRGLCEQWSDQGMWNVLRRRLRERYDYQGTIATRRGATLKPTAVLCAWARARTGFTLRELVDKKAELYPSRQGFGGLLHSVVSSGASVRVDGEHFAPSCALPSDAGTVAAVDEALERLVGHPGDPLACLITTDIKPGDYATLPDVGRAWNGYLLESWVTCRSRRLKLARSDEQYHQRTLSERSLLSIVCRANDQADFASCAAWIVAQECRQPRPEDVTRVLKGRALKSCGDLADTILALARRLRDNPND